MVEIEASLASIEQHNEKLDKCKEKVDAVCKQVKHLTDKLDELENRSHRNNIVFYGLTEQDRETATDLKQAVVNDILKDKLGGDVQSI